MLVYCEGSALRFGKTRNTHLYISCMDKVYSLLGVLAVDSVSCGFV